VSTSVSFERTSMSYPMLGNKIQKSLFSSSEAPPQTDETC
jgi:hypothetical protein